MLIISDNTFFVSGLRACLAAHYITVPETRIVVDTGAGRRVCVLDCGELSASEYADPVSAFLHSCWVVISSGVGTGFYLSLADIAQKVEGRGKASVTRKQMLLVRAISEGKTHRQMMRSLAIGTGAVCGRQAAVIRQLELPGMRALRLSLIAWYKAWPQLADIRRTMMSGAGKQQLPPLAVAKYHVHPDS